MDKLLKLRLLCASVILLQALDLATTAFGLMGGALERNPLVVLMGWTTLVLGKTFAVLGLFAVPFLAAKMTKWQDSYVKWSSVALGATVAFYGVVVGSNAWVAL